MATSSTAAPLSKVYSGVTQEFFGAAALVRKAMEAQTFAGQRLKTAWKK